jgi:hypothetical protein
MSRLVFAALALVLFAGCRCTDSVRRAEEQHIQQLVDAIRAYRYDHRVYPPSLEECARCGYLDKAALDWIHPLTRDPEPYVYVQPPRDAKVTRPMIYQRMNNSVHLGVPVGYVGKSVRLFDDK